MDGFQFLTILFTMIGMWIMNRSEAKKDNKHIESLIISIKDEQKDFHGRLCVLEERYLQIISKGMK